MNKGYKRVFGPGAKRAMRRLELKRAAVRRLYPVELLFPETRQVRRRRERLAAETKARGPMPRRAKNVLPKAPGGRGTPFRHIVARFTKAYPKDHVGVNGFMANYEQTYHATKGFRLMRTD